MSKGTKFINKAQARQKYLSSDVYNWKSNKIQIILQNSGSGLPSTIISNLIILIKLRFLIYFFENFLFCFY